MKGGKGKQDGAGAWLKQQLQLQNQQQQRQQLQLQLQQQQQPMHGPEPIQQQPSIMYVPYDAGGDTTIRNFQPQQQPPQQFVFHGAMNNRGRTAY